MNSSIGDVGGSDEKGVSGGEARAEGAPAGTRPAPLSWQWKAALGAVALAILVMLFWPHGKGTSAPGGFLLDGDGRPSPMGSRLAPVTLVHFWATWCPPCIQESPGIQRLAADLAGYHDFSLLMIAVQDRKDKVGHFLGPEAAAMVLYDPSWDVAHRYGTDQLPETYLVVRGKVVQKFVGATDWDNPDLRRRLLAYLGAPPTAKAAGG
jgi:thiol-disulfide isomerase/thioredoxin